MTSHDDVALLREIHRDHGNLLDVDVVPHVQLGPVRQRKHADALARPNPAVQEMPVFRELTLRVPLALLVAQGKDGSLLARSLLVAPGPAKGRLKFAGLERV